MVIDDFQNPGWWYIMSLTKMCFCAQDVASESTWLSPYEDLGKSPELTPPP